jgi:hypothetical protein
MSQLIIKLLLAHVLGDFVLQPTKWVVDKQTNKHKSKFLYFHILIHLGGLLVCLQFDLKYTLGILLIVISHLAIDISKLNLESRFNKNLIFVTDQIAHFVVIALVVQLYEPFNINFEMIYSFPSMLFILSILVLVWLCPLLIKSFMIHWSEEIEDKEGALQDAGKYIGILERLFVFSFILLNQWAAIGWLITAKSVFRFGDLSKTKDRKLTEYVLIGTLLSFGLAMLIGIVYVELK